MVQENLWWRSEWILYAVR